MTIKYIFNKKQEIKSALRILDQEIINKIEKISLKESENKDADVKIWIPRMLN
ncbi:MAG: hypothetical protein ACYCYI_11825 [Saccharofermentanales bacterium]